MAETTVDGLGELTAPASNDEIGIWDVSASQYLRITRTNLIGGVITGNGTIATGGFTLTVPATGTAVLIGSNVANVAVLQRSYTTAFAAGATVDLSPSVPTYSPLVFLLALSSWIDSSGNPFEQSLYLCAGIGGIYSITRIGGGTVVTATLASGKIRITNGHSVAVKTEAILVALYP